MISWLRVVVRMFVRPLWRDFVRTILALIAVALGVSVVIAIDLAGGAAAGSFRSSLQSLVGRSDFVITATGGVDQQLLGRLVQLPFAFEFVPRIQDFAFVDGKGEAIPFIGLDLIGNADIAENRLYNIFHPADSAHADDFIWAGERLNLKPGSRVRLLVNDRLWTFIVAGIIHNVKQGFGAQNIIITDIGVAQKVTGKLGKLDSIDVRLPSDGSAEHWRQILRTAVPATITVEPEGTRTEENRKMLAAFRWNLRVLSYIALLVGAFLIYNTISISVVRRRNEIGVMRALGATRETVALGFLVEAGFIAALGSALGVFMGRVMALGAVHLIGNTVQSLYVSSEPAPVQLSAASVVSGCALGILISLLAALAPATEASYVAPTVAMARGREEHIATRRSRFSFATALILFAAAAILSLLPPVYGQPMFGYASVIFFVAATAAAIPGLVNWVTRAAGQIVERLLGIEALLALRSLKASLRRTSVLAAALSTAIAMTASVIIMVGSFRDTVRVWMNDQLRADLYLRPAGSSSADRHPTMSADIADKIEKLPGVAAVDRFRAYPISYQGLPATLGAGERSHIPNSAGPAFLSGERRKEILGKLPTGDYAVVSEPFANKHRLRVGSMIRVPLGNASRTFQVLGIYYDYSSEAGMLILDRKTLLKYLPGPAASNIAVYLKPNVRPAEVQRQIDNIIGGRAVLVVSNGKLRRAAIATFDRTFRITYALELVAVLVAVMGVAGALLAMVIDRRREFGLLRFLGAAEVQVRRIVLCEAGLLGLIASSIGLLLGTLLSLVLIFVINKQSFGWTIQFHWPVALLAAALGGIYLATVAAGFLPARVAVNTNPIDVIHDA